MGINNNDIPFFEMHNCYDMLKKMREDYRRLRTEKLNPYNLFNFACSAKHLKDWISEDPSIDRCFREKVRGFHIAPVSWKSFSVINLLCNRGKHFELLKQSKKYEVPKIVFSGYGEVPWGEGGFGDPLYAVILKDKRVNILYICKDVADGWEHFFEVNKKYLEHLKHD